VVHVSPASKSYLYYDNVVNYDFMKYKIDQELKREIDKYLPPLPEVKYQELKENIKKDGYDEAKPIAIWEERPNVIVDGHHRYRACCELGIEPFVVEKSFKSIEEAVLYALRGYLTGRVLNPAQIVIATKHAIALEEMTHFHEEAKESQIRKPIDDFVSGRRPETNEVAQKIADKAKVNVSTVYSVQAIQKEGTPELFKLVERGEIGAKTGKIFVKQVPDLADQSRIINASGAQGVKDIASTYEREIERRAKAAREAEADRKFQAEQAAIKQDVAEYHAVQEEKFGGATYACGLSSVPERWRNPCKCAFDIFKPHQAKFCPVCGGKEITIRDEMWYPGKKVN